VEQFETQRLWNSRILEGKGDLPNNVFRVLIKGRESFPWKVFGADFQHGLTNKVTSFEKATGL
jgi:hypothetical protein